MNLTGPFLFIYSLIQYIGLQSLLPPLHPSSPIPPKRGRKNCGARGVKYNTRTQPIETTKQGSWSLRD